MKKYTKLYALAVLTFTIGVSNAQYIDLPLNIAWNAADIINATTTVDDVESAFNNARTKENTALGTSIPAINFPTNAVWQTYSPNKKAFWIVNQERVARGLLPFEDTAVQVIGVAQQYCQYLVDNDTSGHYADNHNPLYRLQQNADINACMTAYAENIGYWWGSNMPSTYLERIIYFLIYEDAASAWGHRKNFFLSSFNDNSGKTGAEGLLGTGMVISQNYKTNNYAIIAVFNIIDPCATWVYPQGSSGLQGIENTPMVYVTHNPSILHVQNVSSIAGIQISDMNGREVLNSQNTSELVDISSLPSGIYIAQVTSGEKIVAMYFAVNAD
jgi:uncharacterized protein YkwD